MKKNQSLTNLLVTCAVACAMVSTVAAQTEGVAKVIRIKGDARYTTGGGVWQPVKLGALLKPGSVIETSREKGAFVDLVLGDGTAPTATPAAGFTPFIPSSMDSSVSYRPSAEQNVVRVWENSALGIDMLTTTQTGAEIVSETHLDLKMGRITGNVKKMSAASRYEVKLPNGVAGIRGSFYDMLAEGIVRMLVGSSVFAWVDQSNATHTQVIGPNQQFDSRSAQLSPIAPTDLGYLNSIFAMMMVRHEREYEHYSRDRTVHDHGSPTTPPDQPKGPPPTLPD
jgi:hypothetical protein